MLRKLEKYEIEEEIGHGGMATVYRAQDTVLDRTVALKVMHPHLRTAEEARRRFHREARSVARLRHPKVLEIYDFSGEGSEESYIAMELLTGPTLKRWREDKDEIPAEIAACIVIEIAKALEAAHEANIVHRDVKPENVLLHENRTLKLTDFGIADMMDAISMTATGQILGSPGHMAPEQIEGRDSDTRTDLFSLGTVLYYLAAGRLPFTGRNPHQILKRIVDGEYADPLRVNPAIGGPLREIIVKSLETDLEDRYQTATELREELEAFVAKIGIDEPEKTLAEYLKDPDKVGADLRERAIDALIKEGSKAADRGEVPVALDRYNRVLALDEGNEKVMKLIERVGVDRRRRTLMMAGMGLCAVGLATGGIAWAVWPDGSGDDPVVELTEDPLTDPDAGLLSDVEDGSDAGPEQARSDAGAEEADEDGGRPDAGRRQIIARSNGVGRMRTVRFVWQPGNATLAVGDAPPSGEHEYQLAVGRPIEVRVIPGDRAVSEMGYRETTTTVTVPSGTGEHTIRVAAELAPATLVVQSSVPADVRVAGGRGSGRTNDPIFVRLRQPQETPQITVTARDYQPWHPNQAPLLRAGETTTIQARLVPGNLAEAP